MSLENVRPQKYDVRHVLCDTKPTRTRPAPLDEYVYALDLPRAYERIFWIHWEEGYQNARTFLSALSLAEVARRARCDLSTVTRAYRRLSECGLIRRKNPGRNPANKFRQAIVITDALLPREAVSKLLNGPSVRRASPAPNSPTYSNPEISAVSPLQCPGQSPNPVTPPSSPPPSQTTAEQGMDPLRDTGFTVDQVRQWLRPPNSLKLGLAARARLSRSELERYQAFQQGHAAAMHWDAESALTSDQQALLTFTVLQGRLATADPAKASVHRPVSQTAKCPPTIRQLSTFMQADLRFKLTQILPLEEVQERFAEVIYSVERGVLAKHGVHFAINIALSKLRKGLWTRPKGMSAFRIASALRS